MSRLVPLAVAVGIAALGWWEISAGGQLPAVGGDGVAVETLARRYVGHAVFFGLLAAATWVDLRERVIPDWITVPGALLGLAWAGIMPDTLPPIAREVPRSFSVPLVVGDVLGLCGGLRGNPPPAWLGAWPAAGGVMAALAVFAAWWSFGTSPLGSVRAGRLSLPDPRWLILGAGSAGICFAWVRGGDHWAGLVTALAGLAVSASMVWLTRIGASIALGQEAMGFGDVTLMAMVGAWLGWQSAVLVCCLGVVVGLVHGLVQLARHRDNELPFGPSLCLAAVLVVVLWRPIWGRAGPHFQQPLELAAVIVSVIALTGLGLAGWRRIRPRPLGG